MRDRKYGACSGRWQTLALAALLAGVGVARSAGAVALTPFTGDASEVEVSLSDTGTALELTATVTLGLADIRGIFFDVSDAALLDGLVITGDDVTDVQFGDVIDLGNGANLNGGGSPCPCDVGIEIGLPGLRGGDDDFQTTTLLITHETLDLDLSLLQGQLIGVRLTSVGLDEREGSSKLIGVVPEPSTGLMVGGGLGLLAVGRRRRCARGSVPSDLGRPLVTPDSQELAGTGTDRKLLRAPSSPTPDGARLEG